jgi:hypothetical protein
MAWIERQGARGGREGRQIEKKGFKGAVEGSWMGLVVDGQRDDAMT